MSGRRYPVLEFDGQNQTEARVGWSKMDFIHKTKMFFFSLEGGMIVFYEKNPFLPSNSSLSLVLAIELQNRIFFAIQLSKSFKFDHRAVLVGGFNFLFTIKFLDLKMIITFCFYLRFRTFLRSSIRNGKLYLLKYSSYYFITIYYIILILLCKNNNIKK